MYVFELQEIKKQSETLKAVAVKMDACILCNKCILAGIENAKTLKKDETTSMGYIVT